MSRMIAGAAGACLILVARVGAATQVVYSDTDDTVGADDDYVFVDGEYSNGNNTVLSVAGDLTVTGGVFRPAALVIDAVDANTPASVTLGPLSAPASGLVLTPGEITLATSAKLVTNAYLSVDGDLMSSGEITFGDSAQIGGTLNVTAGLSSMVQSGTIELLNNSTISADGFTSVDGEIRGSGTIVVTGPTTGSISSLANPGGAGAAGAIGLTNVGFTAASSYVCDIYFDGLNWVSDTITLDGVPTADTLPGYLEPAPDESQQSLPLGATFDILTSDSLLEGLDNVLYFSFPLDEARSLELQLSGDGKKLQLVVVPEPSVLGFSVIAAMFRRRRARGM